MFRGYKVEPFTIKNPAYLEAGKSLLETQRNIIEQNLKTFIYSDNSLDGSRIQGNWFPQVDVHIFISHSHKDEDLAVAFAGWLWQTFEIMAFVDSMIWGYSDALLKMIDNKYSMNDSRTFYDYNARNISTSHVHMMLSTALAMMIDKTECLLFLSTPNSVTPIEQIESQTKSPWLYYEIAITRLIRTRSPVRSLYEGSKYFSKGVQTSFEVDLSHFTTVDADDFNEWERRKGKSTGENALDKFYQLNPPKKINDSLHG